MKLMTRSANSRVALAATQVYQQLNNQLTIVLRSWGSNEHNQKIVDEITHYLSTTQADLEVTTPFDYVESLSSLGNRARVSLLLAHDLLYKTINKTEFVVGFEVLILFRDKKELAWASVGRFSIAKLVQDQLNYIIKAGTDLDIEVLLPAALIGLEKSITVNTGSIFMDDKTKLILSSTFNNELSLQPTSLTTSLVEVGDNKKGAYWYSVLTPG